MSVVNDGALVKSRDLTTSEKAPYQPSLIGVFHGPGFPYNHHPDLSWKC